MPAIPVIYELMILGLTSLGAYKSYEVVKYKQAVGELPDEPTSVDKWINYAKIIGVGYLLVKVLSLIVELRKDK